MKRPLPILFFILLWPLPARAADFTAKVVGISDGDTMTVLKTDKVQVKIRLHGIDAPETGQDFGSRAKQLASELAFGKEVTIKPHDTDRYGRTVAEVMLPDGRSLNRLMVQDGMAWWYRTYAPNDRALATSEADAKAAKRGIWSQKNPIPPWDWRKGQGVPVTAEVIGNRYSRIDHVPHCRSVAAMSEKNRVMFKTAAEAEGYRKAKDCK